MFIHIYIYIYMDIIFKISVGAPTGPKGGPLQGQR